MHPNARPGPRRRYLHRLVRSNPNLRLMRVRKQHRRLPRCPNVEHREIRLLVRTHEQPHAFAQRIGVVRMVHPRHHRQALPLRYRRKRRSLHRVQRILLHRQIAPGPRPRRRKRQHNAPRRRHNRAPQRRRPRLPAPTRHRPVDIALVHRSLLSLEVPVRSTHTGRRRPRDSSVLQEQG